MVVIMKQTKTIMVYNEESIDYKVPDTPKAFLAFFSDIFALVPEEYIEATNINMYSNSYYDSSVITLNVSYKKLETAAEEKDREARVFTKKTEKAQSDIALLNKLRLEYPDA